MTRKNEEKIIAVLPADGWRVSHDDANDEPVVGWLVYESGHAEALVYEVGGVAVPASGVGDKIIYHETSSDADEIRETAS